MRLDPNDAGYVSAAERAADNVRIAALIKSGAKVDDFRPKKASHYDRDINPAFRRERPTK